MIGVGESAESPKATYSPVALAVTR
jgi:hypothetical protein